MSDDAPLFDDQTLAAELALGLLDDDERRAALARLETDEVFARHHARWQAYAATLFTSDAEAPPPHVWRGIAARLPANDRRGRGLRWWQAVTAASLAVAAMLGVMVVQRSRPVPAPTVIRHVTLVALLTGKGDGAIAVAYDPAGRRLITTPERLELNGRVSELWVIPADGRPISIGVIAAAATGVTTAPGPAAPALAAGATLAVSVEPAGGSPTGQPTGPVILTGKINAS